MHWAADEHTAAEIIYQRIDANKSNLGLTIRIPSRLNKKQKQLKTI
ncbi:hypothetical protein HDE68_004242 [Pedobacter cryoconitis]|uniref:Uncharacterized protein n=1 Tax=Pedobacter cryoconitis TaxID=188932 RepID=A0A7W8ZQG8_9SPHI|nr:hypothetical protein [Pedobacter cryoconitis]